MQGEGSPAFVYLIDIVIVLLARLRELIFLQNFMSYLLPYRLLVVTRIYSVVMPATRL